MRTIFAFLLHVALIGRAAALASEVAPEALAALGIPATPPAFQEARALPGFEERRTLTRAVRADFDGCGRDEIAVLAVADWVVGEAAGEARTLVVYRERNGPWEAAHALEARWPDWAWYADLDAVPLERGAPPSLVVSYSTGGTAGGMLAEAFSWRLGAWRRAATRGATWVALQDVDRDGAHEVLASDVLPSALDFPYNAARQYWTAVLALRGGAFADVSREHAAYYRARLAAVTERLRALDEGTADDCERAHAGYFSVAYAEEAYRCRRVLAGRPAYDEGEPAPAGGPLGGD